MTAARFVSPSCRHGKERSKGQRIVVKQRIANFVRGTLLKVLNAIGNRRIPGQFKLICNICLFHVAAGAQLPLTVQREFDTKRNLGRTETIFCIESVTLAGQDVVRICNPLNKVVGVIRKHVMMSQQCCINPWTAGAYCS